MQKPLNVLGKGKAEAMATLHMPPVAALMFFLITSVWILILDFTMKKEIQEESAGRGVGVN